MSEKRDTSSPAFPRPPAWSPGYQPTHYGGQSGMTLRQWYAGMALAGLATHHANGELDWATYKELAEVSVMIADKMLEALER